MKKNQLRLASEKAMGEERSLRLTSPIIGQFDPFCNRIIDV